MKITAHKIQDSADLPLVPAGKKRNWTNAVKGSSLCVPLFIANQWGWWLLNTEKFTVTNYDGNIVVEPTVYYATSHFGYGVMSVLVPYMFRTQPGWNIWMRGPVNYFKSGIHPFEGIVEADWHPGSALMNWYVEDGARVTFEEGEPLAQILPIKRNIQEFEPTQEHMSGETLDNYKKWCNRRQETISEIRATGKPKFERSYRERMQEENIEVKPFVGLV